MLPLALNFCLVLIYLLLLLVLRLFLPLKLVTDERSRTQPKSSTDCSANAGMTNCGADQASRRSAAERADSCSLFPR